MGLARARHTTRGPTTPALCRSAPSAVVAPSLGPCGTTPQFWHRLPPAVFQILGKYGIFSPHSLLEAPGEVRSLVVGECVGGPYAAVIDALFQPGGPDVFTLLRLSLRDPSRRRASHLVDALPGVGPASTRRAGPTPSQNMIFLQAAIQQGLDIRAACDRVADSRATASVQESSANTYDSHLRQIHRACQILGEPAFPASIETIRRVSSLVGHPSTLRGWLAAWRRLHHTARIPWPADRDPFLVAVQGGLRRSLGPAPTRARCRRLLLRRILIVAAATEAWHAGAFAVLAYMFGLRAPSELVGQATRSSFSCSSRQICYGPIRRKGSLELQTLQRWCCCQQDRILCPHDWLLVLFEVHPEGRLFPHSAESYMRKVQDILKTLGTPDVATYTSHCFRRGSAVDILERHGLQAMLRFGQWSSPFSAAPYASLDEQAAAGLAIAEASGED